MARLGVWTVIVTDLPCAFRRIVWDVLHVYSFGLSAPGCDVYSLLSYLRFGVCLELCGWASLSFVERVSSAGTQPDTLIFETVTNLARGLFVLLTQFAG